MTIRYRYRKQILISLFVVVILITSIVSIFILKEKSYKKEKKSSEVLLSEKSNKNGSKEIKKSEENNQIKEIIVDVKGEVNSPGIYKLTEGNRVIDAINMAGGVTSNGDTSVLNLSKKLIDEMVIIVYSYYEVKNFEKVAQKETIIQNGCVTGINGITNDACISSNDSSNTSKKENKKISINTATLEELMTLDGVGESKAKAIIEYRESNGLFQEIEDIKNVSGIGDSLFDKIKENITL